MTTRGLSVRFWGVRGSIASPGEHTRLVGGNTSCVEVEAGGRTLVLDAGTGLRALGDSLVARGVRDVTLLLSHLHWDHIQGLPFFVPAWRPGGRLEIVGARSTGAPEVSLRDALAEQMQAPHFPVRLEDMRAALSFREVASGQTLALEGDVTVRFAGLNHPGGVLGMRIEHGGRAIVYATDTEHGTALDAALVDLAADADLLIYDAMYTEDEYAGRVGPSRVGWGHSTWQAGAAIADAARVGRLVLFHHDPSRSDRDVEALEHAARASRPGTIAAREGDALVWPEASPDAAREAA